VGCLLPGTRSSTKHLLLACNAVDRFKQEFTAIEQEFHLTKITDKGPELNTDGYKIEAADAVRLLSDPRYADCVRILDLRNPERWGERTILFPFPAFFHVPLFAWFWTGTWFSIC